MHKALKIKLESALASREKRLIRRRLPDPKSHISVASPSPATTSILKHNNGNTNKEQRIIDFTSNDYLSLTLSTQLRSQFLKRLSNAPDILGSGGSRLLVNPPVHIALEERLTAFFGAPKSLLFNSGFDANVGFFSCIPQDGDAIVYDEYIHASVHDGMRSSRVSAELRRAFAHNCLDDLRRVLVELRDSALGRFKSGASSVFLSVESLYSMDGTFSPMLEISALLEEIFPLGNAYLVVDEAHSTGIYGPQGKGRVALLGLEHKVLARLVTFGKALAASGAVVLTNELVRDYLLNYARPLIYTTSLSLANVIAVDASLDMLENGVAQHLSDKLLALSNYFVSGLQQRLSDSNIPPSLLSLPSHLALETLSSTVHTSDPSPIIPLLTTQPRPLSSHLLRLGINARPITWPTVPKGKDRVRVCLHAANTREEVDNLVHGVVGWAVAVLKEQDETRRVEARGEASVAVASKL